MDITENIDFFCLSHNKDNYYTMKNRFYNLGIKCTFYSGLDNDDSRLNRAFNNFNKRQMSITFGHLDIIHNFYNNSNKNYAIICEDDIMIHLNIKEILKKILVDFHLLKLDVLLLGYMLPYKIDKRNNNYTLKKLLHNNSFYKYYEYPEYQSGTQMYMISRSYAKFILEKYYMKFFELFDIRYIFDKIFIKRGNRALIYPMLAIEDDNQDDNYHRLCRNIHYTDWYI